MAAAHAADTPNRIKAAAELQSHEVVRPLIVDVQEEEAMKDNIATAESRMPLELARSCARMFLEAGISQEVQLQSLSTFEVANCWTCVYFPIPSASLPVFGASSTHPPGHCHTYTFCHGTDFAAATLILREMVIRPTIPGDGSGGENDFPAICFYGQAAVGALDLHQAREACTKELRISKGLQGVLVLGEISSVHSHIKIDWSDTVEEARLASKRGIVRTVKRWAFHSSHAQIKGVVIPLPI